MSRLEQSIKVIVRPCADADIAHAVAIHRRVMGYSINALLGASHLAEVYRITAALPEAYVCVATDGKDVLGAASAVLDEEACARAMMRQLPFRLKLRMALNLLLRPACWRALIAARRSSRPVHFDGHAVRACLTSVVVDPQAQGRGVGRALVAAVDDFMHQHAVAAYRLDTRASNTGARAFYAHLGFIEHELRGCDILFVRKL